ncbi:lytic murein transglycosylase B [uncultured Thiothrix sp.]|uniref:lytic murein transglycosylase B n=1 Tax=uncultured Thiothrix sp. TaxID=223185 RepID=UPI00261DC956|nr:lytic murein transglycosylase B [uncultured Thiothrix sp.]
MKAGRLWLGGVMLTSCFGVLSGCTATPQKTDEAASVDSTAPKQTTEQQTVVRAPARPTQSSANGQPKKMSAAQQRLAQLRQLRQQEWDRLQAQKQQRAQAQPRKQAQARQQSVYAQNQQGSGPVSVTYGGKGVGNYYATSLTGDFAGDPRLLSFIEQMSARGFNRNYLLGVFSQVRNRDEVARLWASPASASSPGGWYSYRSKFVTPANIQKGTQFWRQYAGHLQRAHQQYGVDPEYIVGIMGVETRWGRILGKHRIIDALTTSALTNQRRSDFFFEELADYMLMTRTERMDPLAPKGSYAGAMGYGQFMPSSFRSYAVDFDGDGVKDLWNPVDAIGSIANYFAQHGWRSGQEVAVPADVASNDYANVPDGFKVKYSPGQLAQIGVAPKNGRWSNTSRTHLLALSTVPGGYKEPWIGYNNFYVITRYNHSNYYAMAVHQLANAVKNNVGGGN